MILAGKNAEILVTEEGKSVLRLAEVDVPDLPMISVLVDESEDLGLWIRVPRAEGTHVFLLRWEFILGIDLPGTRGRVLGWA